MQDDRRVGDRQDKDGTRETEERIRCRDTGERTEQHRDEPLATENREPPQRDQIRRHEHGVRQQPYENLAAGKVGLREKNPERCPESAHKECHKETEAHGVHEQRHHSGRQHRPGRV